ncbi:MAG: hypothetical protein Q9227_002218 [Pyrenula ochraceoflavens]
MPKNRPKNKRTAQETAGSERKRVKLFDSAPVLPRADKFKSLASLAENLPQNLFEAFPDLDRRYQLRHLADSYPKRKDNAYWKILTRYERVRFPDIEETAAHKERAEATKLPDKPPMDQLKARRAINTFRAIRKEAQLQPELSTLAVMAGEREADYLSYLTQYTFGAINLVNDFDEHFDEVVTFLEQQFQCQKEAQTQAAVEAQVQAAIEAQRAEIEQVVREGVASEASQQSNLTSGGSSKLSSFPPSTHRPTQESQNSWLVSDDYLNRNFKEDEGVINHALEWSSIHGMDSVKDLLLSSMGASRFSMQGPQGTPDGVLLFGPSGTGKTAVSQSLAKHINRPLFVCSPATVKGKLQGESPKLVENLFRQAENEQPSIILLDEADSLLMGSTHGNEAVREIQGAIKAAWSKMQGKESKVLVIGTSNKPWDIPKDGYDRRLRFHCYVGPLNRNAREKMWRERMSPKHWLHTESPLDGLLDWSEGFTGDDIKSAVKNAERVLYNEANVSCSWSFHTQHNVWMPADSKKPVEGIGSETKSWEDMSEQERQRIHPGFLTPALLLDWLKEGKILARSLMSDEEKSLFETWARSHS